MISVNKKIVYTMYILILIQWCLHAESNYELILTMDPLYHLTMEAAPNRARKIISIRLFVNNPQIRTLRR